MTWQNVAVSLVLWAIIIGSIALATHAVVP
jgi:hypothetical protein